MPARILTPESLDIKHTMQVISWMNKAYPKKHYDIFSKDKLIAVKIEDKNLYFKVENDIISLIQGENHD